MTLATIAPPFATASICYFQWPTRPKPVAWSCPASSSTEIQKAFSFAKDVQEKIEAHKKKWLATPRIYFKMAANVLLGCCQREVDKACFAGLLFRKVPAWKYQEDAKSVESLKKVEPWAKTPCANAKDMFAKARADLFAGKNKLYNTTPIQCSITCCDKTVLNGIYFPGKAKKVILLAVGLTAMYEECMIDFVYDKLVSFFKSDCNDLNVLMVNTRGIGQSKNVSTPQTLSLDIYSAYQFLIHHYGYDPEDVLVYGHSLGGCYGLQGAALIQKEYPAKKISAVVDRSFVAFSDVIDVRFGKIAKRLFCANHLDVQSQTAAEALKGKIISIVTKEDTTVPFKASFSEKLIRKKIHLEVIELGPTDPKKDPHIRKFTSQEAKKIAKAILNLFNNWQ